MAKANAKPGALTKKKADSVWVVTSAVELLVDELDARGLDKAVSDRLQQLGIPPEQAESSGLIAVFSGRRLQLSVDRPAIRIE